jgi:hypothetical protein
MPDGDCCGDFALLVGWLRTNVRDHGSRLPAR